MKQLEVEKLNGKSVVHWFRTDQRVSDHAVFSYLFNLKSATAFYLQSEKFEESHPLNFPWVSAKRKTFLQESLSELSAKLSVLGVDL